MTEPTFTISQLARICDKSRNTLTAWCASGRISSIRENGRSLIPMSEVLRVFPKLKPADLELALQQENDKSPSKSPSVAQQGQGDNQTGPDVAKYLAQIENLKASLDLKIDALEQKTELVNSLNARIVELQARITELTTDKRTLAHQLEVAEHQFDRLDRLITLTASNKKPSPSATQARDAHGRFAGKGTGALFQQGTLTDETEPV